MQNSIVVDCIVRTPELKTMPIYNNQQHSFRNHYSDVFYTFSISNTQYL